jgi:dipeptidyl aminopeptidase/acylaminoacyl peptidase
VRQLTRTGDATELLTFVGRDEVAFRVGDRVLAVALTTNLTRLVAALRAADDPDKPKLPQGVRAEAERRLFDTVRRSEEQRAEKAAQEAELARQATSAPRPWYFGKDKALRTVSLSPDGRRLIVGVTAAELRGRRERMPVYVNPEGYVDPKEVRTKVGSDQPLDETFFLLDLPSGKKRTLQLAALPGIAEDPLAALREAAEARKKAKAEAEKKAAGETGEDATAEAGKDRTEAGAAKGGRAEKADGKEPAKPRAVYGYAGSLPSAPASPVAWTEDGARAAISLFAYDNKDRWIAEIDWAGAAVRPVHRLTDAAWVNDYAFNEFGWLPDGSGMWYLSEESGYSRLYVRRGSDAAVALTPDRAEASSVQVDPRDGWFYYRANRAHPGRHDVWRVSLDGQREAQVTTLGGGTTYELSGDGTRLLLEHGTTTRAAELYVQAAVPGATARKVFSGLSEAFARIDWEVPEIVAVPSAPVVAPVYARVYGRKAAVAGGAPRRAVMFVHGAGYLQNAHEGWSQYFREFMFHQLLVQRGFVVIDMDFRASAGYGRDWRTAIHRRMGTPEIEDFRAGVEWLVRHANVDRARVGVYGGSYGGFMTLMALFRAPELFAAGAALRPVTDWAHYNHNYTSNILHTPELDPEAYAASSPIEFADGLRRPLLISHGMLDDNVLFQDSVRLAQRLIELKKENWEVAIFPVEAHAYREAVSWLDQYRRVLRLMERM